MIKNHSIFYRSNKASHKGVSVKLGSDHQKEPRIDAHLFISILAYHLLHVIRYQLKMKGIKQSWETLREVLGTHCRITSVLQLKNGKVVQVRKTSLPDPNQLAIYKALNIEVQPGKIEKVYC